MKKLMPLHNEPYSGGGGGGDQADLWWLHHIISISKQNVFLIIIVLKRMSCHGFNHLCLNSTYRYINILAGFTCSVHIFYFIYVSI